MTTGLPSVGIIIPAHNEESYIGDCLAALFKSADVASSRVEIVVVANACSDKTVLVARAFADTFRRRGWTLNVVDCPQAGKLNALNLAETKIDADITVYLDADVIVSPGLLPAMTAALQSPEPKYASGTPHVAPARNWFTRAYARCWAKLPFVVNDVPGFGIFAVNKAGRSRWQVFPEVISDDTFVRLHFDPTERVKVAATYSWPMVEGIENLVRVRRRQDQGVVEIKAIYPKLAANDKGSRATIQDIARQFVSDPMATLAYLSVTIATRLPVLRTSHKWARGR